MLTSSPPYHCFLHIIAMGYDPPDGLSYLAIAVGIVIFFLFGYFSECELPYRFFNVRKEDLYEDEHQYDSGDMDDWEAICMMAVEQAKRGDHRAREWVVKHMRDNADGVSADPDQDKEIVKDAITALRSVGYKDAEAKKVINSLLKERSYDSVEELIKDALAKR